MKGKISKQLLALLLIFTFCFPQSVIMGSEAAEGSAAIPQEIETAVTDSEDMKVSSETSEEIPSEEPEQIPDLIEEETNTADTEEIFEPEAVSPETTVSDIVETNPDTSDPETEAETTETMEETISEETSPNPETAEAEKENETAEEETAEATESDSVELFAATNGTMGSISWDLQDGTLTLTGSGQMPSWDESANRAPWLKDFSNDITKIVIEEGITSIGSCAFSACVKWQQ